MENLKSGQLTVEEVMNLMIGAFTKHRHSKTYLNSMRAPGWAQAKIIKFEDLLEHIIAVRSLQRAFFLDLLAPMGISSLPDDWRGRIRLGSSKN